MMVTAQNDYIEHFNAAVDVVSELEKLWDPDGTSQQLREIARWCSEAPFETIGDMFGYAEQHGLQVPADLADRLKNIEPVDDDESMYEVCIELAEKLAAPAA
ncbi:hypothetical protein [Corynebacterium argentoratense]|uniref:hypothetical protein n=1 Tax=Corynebacterium argentoratense TaxID=42817 RepID=UPI0028EA3B80|nr:hypothetical protein [Corynebacterium argentoratense]